MLKMISSKMQGVVFHLMNVDFPAPGPCQAFKKKKKILYKESTEYNHMDSDKLACCKKKAGLKGYNPTLMLGVYRTVIKLSTVHSSITRYTNMLHNETESVHPILWCAYTCRATSTDCGRPVTR